MKNMFIPKNAKHLNHKLKAVSPVIATLVLIVIAIVGAVAVGLIMSRVAATTSGAANVNNVSQNAATTLTIGGSTTIFPVTSSSLGTFESEYPGINVQLVQGGSGAGMEGVIIGALDIGEASSYFTFSSYQSSAAALNPPVNLVGTNIGGSGVVFIENDPGNAGNLLLTDGANVCSGITSAAAEAAYNDGTFYIGQNACLAAGPTFSVLTAPFVCASQSGACATSSGPFTAVSRSDIPSGTQETAGAWMGFSSSQQDSNQFGTTTPNGQVASGNPGLLAAVAACSYSGSKGCLGFVDIGFAEAGSLDSVASTGVAIPALVTSTSSGDGAEPTQLTAAPKACSAASVPSGTSAAGIVCYANQVSGDQSTSHLDTTIKNALAGSGPEFPDNQAGTNVLSRTFWLVTNGTPDPVEQDFINFLINPAQAPLFTTQGYYPVYSYKTG